MAPEEPIRQAFGMPYQPSWIAPIKPTVPDHELLVRIGGGSYGDVWLARSVVGTWRAVKVVFRDRFLDARPYEREFSGIQKFEPLSRSNEGFVDILQIGRNDAQGYFYYVMELADDATDAAELRQESYVPKTLSKALLQRGRLPVSECLELGITLNLALARLHSAGLIHRDIKPSNIIFVGGVPKLADIGLVIEFAEARSYVGTEGFIPPEGPNSPQADIYSLGKVLYEAGMGKDRKDFPEPPTQIAEVPDSSELLEFNAVLLKACAANVKDRYQSAGEMNADLALLQSGGSVRHQRTLRRRLRSVQRASFVVATLAVVISAGWFRQVRQTRLLRELANEKTRLAGEKTQLANENRERLVHLRVARGVTLMNQGDFSEALLWFAETLPLVDENPGLSWAHRLRLQSVLDHTLPLHWVFRQTAAVRDLRFSPDGQWLATASDDRTARVWSLATGEPASPPLSHTTNVHWVNFSTNSQHLATLSADGRLQLWSATDSWRPILTLSNLADASPCMDCDLISVAYVDGRIEMRDHSTGGIVGKPFTVEGRPTGVGYSPDSKTLAVACEDKVVRFYSLDDGHALPQKLVHEEPIQFLGFSRDGHRLLVVTRTLALDHGLRFSLWDPANGRHLVGPLPPHSGNLARVRFIADGKSLLVSSDTMLTYRTAGALELWNAETGEFVRTLAANVSATDARLSPTGNLVAWGSRGGETMLIDLETGAASAPPLHHSASIESVAFNRECSLLATSDFLGIVKVWGLKTPASNYPQITGATLASANAPEATQTRFSPDGNKLVTATARRARVWSTADWKVVGEYIPPTGYEVHSVLWEQEKATFVCVLVGPTRQRFHVRLAYLETDQLGPPLITENNNGMPAASADGSLLATVEIITNGGPYFVHVWRTTDGKEAIPRIQLPAFPRFLRWSADKRLLATGGSDGITHIWVLNTGKELLPALKQDEAVPGAEFSWDGRRLATGSLTQGARIWELGTGRLLTPPLNHAGYLDRPAWSPDDRSVLTCGQGFAIRQWDAATGQPNVAPMEHANALTCARYTHDGRLILSSSLDGTARVWSALTGEPSVVPIEHGQRVNDVRADPADRGLITLTHDGAMRVVPLRALDSSLETILDYARAVTSQELDRFETAQPIEATRVIRDFRELKAKHPNFPSR